ncbi:MAG: hypothetical protein M1120_00655 [Patescibacteria group bacterium]|nr:hypothetical protein [Patescibacteria group bacterium]
MGVKEVQKAPVDDTQDQEALAVAASRAVKPVLEKKIKPTAKLPWHLERTTLSDAINMAQSRQG